MKILSFGEIIWDVYGTDGQTLGGAPLNFAAYAAMQGGTVYLMSSVGDDPLGARAIEEIEALGIKTEYIAVSSKMPTGRCDVLLDGGGVPTYRLAEDTAYDRIPALTRLCDGFDAIVFGTLALRGEQNRETLRGILEGNTFSEIYTDLNIRPPFYSEESVDFCLGRATVVKISDEELPLVTRLLFSIEADSEEATRLIADRYRQIKLLVITCGEKGAICYDTRAKKMLSCAAVPTVAVSTVGAGDSFGATFLTQYLKTRDIQYALALSAKVSSFVVSHRESIPESVGDFIGGLIDG